MKGAVMVRRRVRRRRLKPTANLTAQALLKALRAPPLRLTREPAEGVLRGLQPVNLAIGSNGRCRSFWAKPCLAAAIVVGLGGLAYAGEPKRGGSSEAQQDDDERPSTYRACQHVLPIRLDVDSSEGTAFGSGYLHAHWWGRSEGSRGILFIAQYGASVQAVADGTGVHGIVAHALGRVSSIANTGGVGLELGVGGGGPDAPGPLAVAGGFFGFYYFELGASGHFPLGQDRPHWLPGLSFGIRFNVPLSTYAEQRTYLPGP